MKMMSRETLLVRGLAALDFDISSGFVEKLNRYVDEIEKWNPLYGLVNAEGEELVIKHVLDSLSPWRILADRLAELDSLFGGQSSVPVADIGTGAGLPGIPLALAFPERTFVLIERLERRLRFLESTKALLGLENVVLHPGSVEDANISFPCAVFRAFRPFSERKVFRAIWRSLSPGGMLMAYKGRLMQARMELGEISDDPVLGELVRQASIEPVWVPFLDEERCVVIVRKPAGY